ncbi:MAG TPA: phosphatase PAP2 family protein, partial [Sphingobacteriaceae bacterium]
PLTPLLGPALGYSFPSGHAMSSVTFFGLLIYFIWKRAGLNPGIRYLIISLLVLLICIIGISRIYLRVHYASDVIAGFCVGLIWLVISINLLDRIEKRNKTKLRELVEEQPPGK